jgi:GNAT superfamily N-acetyltransferase
MVMAECGAATPRSGGVYLASEFHMTVEIRRFVPQGSDERLRQVAIAAKAHWGHPHDRVVEWASKGDFSARTLGQLTIWVAEVERRDIAGWASLARREGVAWLEDLWVHPRWMGQGVGSALFAAVADEARRRGASSLEWEAEPNALGFYRRMGGRYLRDSPTTEWGRVLPIMGIDLP